MTVLVVASLLFQHLSQQRSQPAVPPFTAIRRRRTPRHRLTPNSHLGLGRSRSVSLGSPPPDMVRKPSPSSSASVEASAVRDWRPRSPDRSATCLLGSPLDIVAVELSDGREEAEQRSPGPHAGDYRVIRRTLGHRTRPPRRLSMPPPWRRAEWSSTRLASPWSTGHT